MSRKKPNALAGINVSEDAAAILRAASLAAEAALARRETLDREGRRGDPLVILAGEQHSMPTHIVFHILLLESLRVKEPALAVADEIEHDLLAAAFARRSSGQIEPWQKRQLAALDTNGHLSLKALVAWNNFKCADHSNAALYHYMLRRGLPSFFSDVALDENNRIAAAEPSTRASIRACFARAAAGLDPEEREAIKIRNHHMATKIAGYAQQASPRIIFQRCGRGHVAGSAAGEDCPGAESLGHMLKEKDIPVLGLFPEAVEFGAACLPPDHGLAGDELLVIQGLAEREAMYGGPAGILPPLYPVDFRCRIQEAEYLNALLAATGLDRATLTVPQYNQRKEQLDAEVTGKFAQLKAA